MTSKEILEKICKIASKNAKNAGRYIDYDKLLYIKFFQGTIGYGWRLVAFDPLNNNKQTSIQAMNGNIIDLGEMFLREVPTIEREYEIEKILKNEKNEMLIEASKAGNLIMLPVVGDHLFFSDKAMDMLIKALTKNGSKIVFTVLNEEYEKIKHKNNIAIKKIYNDLEELAKTFPDGKKNPAWRKAALIAMNNMQNSIKEVEKKTYYVEIPIVDKICNTIEEVGIWIDLNGI